MTKIVGVDYSMSCPALCVLADDGSFANSKFFFLTSRKRDISIAGNIRSELHLPYSTEEERYDHISNSMVQFLHVNTKLDQLEVYIEDYSMGSKGRVFNIAENTGLFKHKLHRLEIDTHLIAPTVIKKFATGKGNADKQKMYAAFLARGNPSLDHFLGTTWKPGDNVGSPVSDLVDSYFIALYGLSLQAIAAP